MASDPKKLMFTDYRWGAKKRNLEFALEYPEFVGLITSPCHWCGGDPTPRVRKKLRLNFVANGIDRVDSNKGYVLSNCVTCCQTCNSMKSDLDPDAWVAHVERIFRHTESNIPKNHSPSPEAAGGDPAVKSDHTPLPMFRS